MKAMNRITIIGDSILKGVQLQKETKRYTVEDCLALDSLADQFGLTLENCSRFGYTIDRGGKLVMRQLEKGLPADTVILEYGGNDADFRWDEVSARPLEEHEPNTPLPVFLEQLERLVEQIRNRGIRPVLTTLPPISASRYLSWITRNGLSKENILLWLGDEGAIYRYQERYSNGIKELAEKKTVDLVDLRDAFLAQRQLLPYLCEDGIHPNSAGQKLIHDAFARKLELLAVR
jgi:lysophospholipase L1-like esterase